MKSSNHITTTSTIINWSDGTTTLIPCTDRNYAKIIKGIHDGLPEAKLRNIINTVTTWHSWSGGSIVERAGIVYAKTPEGLVRVPDQLRDVLNRFKEINGEARAFCRFLYKLMQNPSKTSVDTFYSYVKRYDLTITDEGNVRGYKAVTWEWLDKHTETIKNTIGSNPKMERNQVCDNPNVACSTGFHFGSVSYVKGFAARFGQPKGDRIILVDVDPADIVCVPHDCDCGKVRCSSYKVVAAYVGELEVYAGAGLKGGSVLLSQQDVERLLGLDCFEGSAKCRACGYEFSDKREKFCPECGTRR
jgi:hypothetical protein